MATLEWGDTFDHYEERPTGMASRTFANWEGKSKWSSISADDTGSPMISTAYGRPGPGASKGCLLNQRAMTKTLPLGAQATRMVACWWNPNTGQLTTGSPILAFWDAGAEQLSIRLDGSGHIIVSRAGTTLFTSTNTVSANTWYWIEFKATIHNSAGVYEVRVNGSSTNWVPQQTGANTRGTGSNNSATQLTLNLNGGQNVWYWDDVCVFDDFTGILRGAWLAPSAAGNHQDWTPNNGDNRGAVDEDVPDGDTSFVASATSGHIDTFELENIPAASASPIYLQHVVYAKQDAGTPRTIRPKTRISSTDYSGTSVALGASYVYITEAVTNNPNTSAAWTKAGVDGAEFGYENV